MINVESRAEQELQKSLNEAELLAAKEDFSKGDERRLNVLLAKIATLRSSLSAAERRAIEIEKIEREAGLRPGGRLAVDVRDAWREFARHGRGNARMTKDGVELRYNESGTQSISYTQQGAGGVFVPQGFSDRAFETMKQYDQIFDPQYSTVVDTDAGNPMPFPTYDDVTVSSVQTSEAVQSAEADIAAIGSKLLNAYTFRSKIVIMSMELIMDMAFSTGEILERIFAKRHARGVGAALINGTGVNQPTGLLTGILAAGVTPKIATGSKLNTGGSETGATTIGSFDCSALLGSVDASYRPGSVFYMNDSTFIYLQSLVSAQGVTVALFEEGLPRLLGKPVALCPSMPTMGAGKNCVIFGNPGYFIFRRVPRSMYVQRFYQAPGYVENGLVGFQSYLRCDSNVLAPDSSYLPFGLLQNHS